MTIKTYNEDDFDGELNLTKFQDIPAMKSIRLISATPTTEQVKLMAGPMFCNGSPFIADISARDAIQSGDILPVKASICKVQDKSDVPTMVNVIRSIFEQNQVVNGPIVRCLVTETTVENLKTLKDALVAAGVPVFYTTSATGKWFEATDKQSVEYKSITDFSKAVNAYDKDCVILHIRQVIAGVDISGLTHTVIRNCANTQKDTVRMVQTIGRTLRYHSSEERQAMTQYIKSLILDGTEN